MIDSVKVMSLRDALEHALAVAGPTALQSAQTVASIDLIRELAEAIDESGGIQALSELGFEFRLARLSKGLVRVGRLRRNVCPGGGDGSDSNEQQQ